MNSFSPNPDSSQYRRLRLRLLAKCMTAVGMFGAIYVLLSGLSSGNGVAEKPITQQVELADMSLGEIRFLTWEGRPVLIHRRRPDQRSQLVHKDERLLDASSSRSTQPAAAANNLRSLNPAWFVAIGLGTDYGCPVKELPAVEAAVTTGNGEKNWQEKPWQGGFLDTCRGSRYDYAGRVFADQFADSNLVVPDYAIIGDTLILGQEPEE